MMPPFRTDLQLRVHCSGADDCIVDTATQPHHRRCRNIRRRGCLSMLLCCWILPTSGGRL